MKPVVPPVAIGHIPRPFDEPLSNKQKLNIPYNRADASKGVTRNSRGYRSQEQGARCVNDGAARGAGTGAAWIAAGVGGGGSRKRSAAGAAGTKSNDSKKRQGGRIEEFGQGKKTMQRRMGFFDIELLRKVKMMQDQLSDARVVLSADYDMQQQINYFADRLTELVRMTNTRSQRVQFLNL